LTGKDTDALAEEKQRGISITLGFAHVRVGGDTDIDLIDMPGHERFLRTMISGATGIDAASMRENGATACRSFRLPSRISRNSLPSPIGR
jgi:translation initiation factor 2 gamma subunit (eIF-2gamma)